MSNAGPALLALVLLAACNSAGSAGPASDNAQPDEVEAGDTEVVGAWVLERGVGPAGPIEPPEGMRITLIPDGPHPGGQACNHYGVDVRRAGNAVTMTITSMTEMACGGPMMQAESAYIAAIEAVEHAGRTGDRLVLRGAESTELVFSLLPTAPLEDLTGTHWRLESVVADGVGSEPLGEPTLEFPDDGTLAGSSGCRDFVGSGLRVNGDQLVLSTFGGTDASIECPAKLVDQDSRVFEVIGDGFIVELEGDTLVLRDPSGLALVYRPAD